MVVASPFFPHKLSRGYSSAFSGIVKSINGVAIKNLAHLVTVLRDSQDEFLVVEFYGRGLETLHEHEVDGEQEQDGNRQNQEQTEAQR